MTIPPDDTAATRSDPQVIVLKTSVGRDAIHALAQAHRWRTLGEVDRGHFVLASERYVSTDGTSIEYLEDHTGGVQYMQVRGASQDAIASMLRQELPHFLAEGLLRDVPASDDPLEWIRGLSRLAATRPSDTSARYLAIWSRALSHPETPVRRAAIRTCYGCWWPELLPIVRARLQVERSRSDGSSASLTQPLASLLEHLERIDRRRQANLDGGPADAGRGTASATNPPTA